MTTKWRTGRRVGRTIYVQEGPRPSDDDLLIGMMDSAELAALVVEARNVYIEQRFDGHGMMRLGSSPPTSGEGG